MNLSFENAERLRKLFVALRRQIDSKDAQIAALRQRVEDDAQKIADLRSEVANLEFWLAEKHKQVSPRAIAQLKQIFRGVEFYVSQKS